MVGEKVVNKCWIMNWTGLDWTGLNCMLTPLASPHSYTLSLVYGATPQCYVPPLVGLGHVFF